MIGKMRVEAGWNGFAGLIRPSDRSLENPDVNYEEEWWQHTPLSESNTNNERLWLNSVHTDTIFWAGIHAFDGPQKESVNTLLPQHPPKLFTRNPAIYFPAVDKTCACIHLWQAPRISRKLLQNEICFVVLRAIAGWGFYGPWGTVVRGSPSFQ